MSDYLQPLNTAYLQEWQGYGNPGEFVQRHNLSEIHNMAEVQKVDTILSTSGGDLGAAFRNPIIWIFKYMDQIADYFAGEFIPTCESDKKFLQDFRRIWRIFIRHWYFGEVYIAYSEEIKNKEKAAIEGEGKSWFVREHYPRSNFRLFSRANKDENEFTSLFNTNVKVTIDPKFLVCCSYDSMRNFFNWYEILRDYIHGLNMVNNALRTSVKVTHIKSGDETKIKKLEQQLLNPRTYIVSRSMTEQDDDDQDFEQYPFYPVQDVIPLLKSVKAMFDERAAPLGWFGKDLDNKKERVTVQEGAMTTKLVNNILESMLLDLRVIVGDLKEIYPQIPEDFDIEIERIKPQLNNMPMSEQWNEEAIQGLKH